MYVTYECIKQTNDSAFGRFHLADLGPELGVYTYRSIKKKRMNQFHYAIF